MSGMLGLDGDAVRRTLMVAPHLPQGWTVDFDRFRVGGATVSGRIARVRGEVRISLTVAGGPLAMELSPAFAAGASLRGAEVNGARAAAQLVATPGDAHVSLRTGALSGLQAVIRVEEAAEAAPVLAKPEPGDPARPRQ